MDDRDNYNRETIYLGYQNTLGRDWHYYIQGGAGYDSNQDAHGDLYLDLLKPLTRSTLLRFSDEAYASTADDRANTLYLHLIQALNRKLAVDFCYRYYAAHQSGSGASVDQVAGDETAGDQNSNQVAATLIWQLHQRLYLMPRYTRYWNSNGLTANGFALDARWNATNQLSVVGGYQVQQYESGPVNHGFRLGLRYDF